MGGMGLGEGPFAALLNYRVCSSELIFLLINVADVDSDVYGLGLFYMQNTTARHESMNETRPLASGLPGLLIANIS